MRSFTLDGITYVYENPKGFESSDEVHSWEYGHYPKGLSTVPLAARLTVDVYGESTRWSPTHISVSWVDDIGHTYWAWIPKTTSGAPPTRSGNIEQYRCCLPELRVEQWGKRLPGFLPA